MSRPPPIDDKPNIVENVVTGDTHLTMQAVKPPIADILVEKNSTSIKEQNLTLLLMSSPPKLTERLDDKPSDLEATSTEIKHHKICHDDHGSNTRTEIE